MTNPETPSTAPVAWCRSDDFRDALQKVQSFNGWRVRYPDCDMALYAQLQASAAPDADQAEGPSLADVDELCEEFSFNCEDRDSLEVLRDMITAAITRWRAHGSVAQSGVVAAIISKVDSKPGQPVALPTFTPALSC
jgi:hypothetical protein